MKHVRIGAHNYFINWLSNSPSGVGYFEVLYATTEQFLDVFQNKPSDYTLYFLDYTRKIAKLQGLKYSENRGGFPVKEVGTERLFLVTKMIEKHHLALIAD